MKALIILATIIISGPALAQKKEKSLELEGHVTKVTLKTTSTYDFEMLEFAAIYHADEKYVGCLQEAMRKNKKVSLKITAYSQNILECRVLN